MNNWKLWVAIGCMCCAPAARVQARTPEAHAVRIGSIEELQAYFTYSPDRDIVVSGHRGGMMAGYPENCIESCEKTFSLLPTFFEIDFSFTKDSIPVLMHDLTIDRTTTGKGRVSDYTYEELQQFALVDRHRKETPYKIPRLKDMLEWGKDRVVFNFDNKYVNTKGVSDRVRRASIDYYIRQLQPGGDWAEYHNIVLSVRSLDEALRYWNSGIRQVMFCVGGFRGLRRFADSVALHHGLYPYGRRSPVAGGLRSAACPGRDDDDFDRGDLRQGEERPRPQYGLFAGAAGRTGYHRNRLSLGVRRTASFAPGDSRFAGLRVAQPFAKMILR